MKLKRMKRKTHTNTTKSKRSKCYKRQNCQNDDEASTSTNIHFPNYQFEELNTEINSGYRSKFIQLSSIHESGEGASNASLEHYDLSPFQRNLTNEYIDVGDCNCVCQYCGALFWKNEQTQNTYPPKFFLCCQNGKIMLPLMKKTPSILDELLDYYGGPLSVNFRKNIRIYNSMFAFTSFGTNIQSDINKSSGPYIFKISGQIHHLIGSLLPINNNPPKFAQLYIYDTENEVQNRIATLSNNNDSNNLNEIIVQKIIIMLDETNKLVQLFRNVRDVYKNHEIPSMKLRLIGRRQGDSAQYDLPTSTDIGGLIVGDFGLYEKGRDIIIHSQTGELQRINKLHPSYMALQYPLLFPYGEDGYRIDIKWNSAFIGKQPRRNRISMRSFYAFQFQQRLHEGNTLFRSGRLFQQYIVDSYASIEEDRLDYVRQNQNNFRSDFYKGIQDAIIRGDTNAEAIGKRIILPSSYTGSPRYMIQNYQDAMAICRHYGNPDIFLTFTCNPKWPEIKRSLNKIPGQKSNDRPDIISRMFKIKLDHLLKTIKSGDIFGPIIAGELIYST